MADLLAIDPARDEWLAMLDEIRETHGDLERLLGPVDAPRPYYATEAVRALCWLRAGRLAEGIVLLVSVMRAKPKARYLDAWALPALAGPGLQALGHARATQLLAAVLASLREHHELPERRAVSARAWAELALGLSRSAQGLDSETRAHLDMLVGGVCRRAGRLDEGLAALDVEARPSWHAWTARGLPRSRAAP